MRMMSDLFALIATNSADLAVSVAVTYCEVYNEIIKDLLDEKTVNGSAQRDAATAAAGAGGGSSRGKAHTAAAAKRRGTDSKHAAARSLPIREDATHGPYVAGLKQCSPTT